MSRHVGQLWARRFLLLVGFFVSLLLAFVAIIMCLGGGVASIMGFFGRSHWVLDLLSHFRWQYFLLLGVVLSKQKLKIIHNTLTLPLVM